MRVVIDEQEVELQANSVGEAISQAAERAERDGRLIVDVTVDGEPMTDDQITSTEAIATVAEEVRLQSADPHELVAATFSDAAEALGQADELQREAAELIQSGQTQPAMNQLNEAISIWMSVQQAVAQGSELISLDLDAITVDGTPVSESIQSLNGHLRTMKEALNTQDFVGVSDTLLYELPETSRQWRDILLHLQQRVEEEAGRS